MTSRRKQPKRGSPEHKAACAVHAGRRLWQRYGIALGAGEYERINAQARAAAPLMACPRGKLLKLELKGRTVYAIFDQALDCIVTFPPRPAMAAKRGDIPVGVSAL
jgi:hypothetical protein